MENEFVDKDALEVLEKTKREKEKKAKEKKAKRKAKAKSNKSKSKGPGMFVQILNGDFLSKEFMLGNLGFIFFVMFLLLLTVGKGYYGKELSKEVVKTQEELDEVTSDYFEAKARLEEETQRIKLVNQLEPRGVKETVNPTKVIKVKKKDNE